MKNQIQIYSRGPTVGRRNSSWHCMKHVHILQYSKLVLVGIVPYTPTFTKLYHWLNRWAAILNWLRQALWVQNILNVGIELPIFIGIYPLFVQEGLISTDFWAVCHLALTFVYVLHVEMWGLRCINWYLTAKSMQ